MRYICNSEEMRYQQTYWNSSEDKKEAQRKIDRGMTVIPIINESHGEHSCPKQRIFDKEASLFIDITAYKTSYPEDRDPHTEIEMQEIVVQYEKHRQRDTKDSD